MNQEDKNRSASNEKQNREMQDKIMTPDALEQMLISAYSTEKAPEDVNVRLKNQLACRKVMESSRISVWWLPATLSTVVSTAFAIILCLIYVIVNIKGADMWMPNFVQFISEMWLKIHLAAIGSEIGVSWLITFLGIWKGNLVRNAKL